MKHAAVLYTCIGLMGAAAITGFVDYTQASNAGTLASLYKEERLTTGSTLMAEKEINIEDYSRAALEEPKLAVEEQEVITADNPKPKKKKKNLPPPPPPPKPKKGVAVEEVYVVEAPVAPPAEAEVVIAEVPATPPAEPVAEVKPETPPAPVVVEETKPRKISAKFFSRAPLPPKVTVAKKKKG